MDILTMEKLKEIIATRSDRCVSLYMPTYRSGQETEQNAIRFKNLLSEAQRKLEAKGVEASLIDKMLKEPRLLLQGSSFWQHQSDGLAVFFSEDSLHLFRLPIAFAEMVILSTRFHIKALLPILNSDGPFHILALSQNQVRLFEGNQYTVDEIDLGYP